MAITDNTSTKRPPVILDITSQKRWTQVTTRMCVVQNPTSEVVKVEFSIDLGRLDQARIRGEYREGNGYRPYREREEENRRKTERMRKGGLNIAYTYKVF